MADNNKQQMQQESAATTTDNNKRQTQNSVVTRQNVLNPISRPAPRSQAQVQQQGASSNRVSYEDMYKRLNVNPALTPEQVKKQQKREKWGKIASAIGDGISSLANLYFTTQGAPNAYNSRTPSVSKATGRKWAQIHANQNERMQAYIKGLERARGKDAELAEKERKWQRELAIDRQERKDKEAEQKRKQEMHEQELAKAKSDAQRAQTEAEYAPEYQQSRINQNEASATASTARARSYNDRNGGGAEKYHVTFRNTVYKTQADYEKAVLGAAEEVGVPTYEDIVIERNWKGVPTKTKRVNRDIAAIAAQVEQLDKKNAEYNSWKSSWKK